LNDPFHEETVAPPFGEHFESDDVQQNLASSLLVQWDEKRPCEESVIVIKGLQDEKSTSSFEVLNSVFEEPNDQNWCDDDKNPGQLVGKDFLSNSPNV
jgi:hypothetical protein